MFKVSQGHKSNVVGEVESIVAVRRLIRAHAGKRWKPVPHVFISKDEKSAVAATKSIAVHYQIQRVN